MKLDGMTDEEFFRTLTEKLAEIERKEQEEALKQQNEVASKTE